MKEIKFEINEVEYVLPEFINIENYVKIFKIKEIFSDEYFAAKLLNILTGAPVELLLEAPYNEIDFLANYAMSLFPTDKPKFVDKFELDGKHYGFIASWKKLSFAEYADLDTLMTKKGDEMLDYIHIIMAIMYRPIIGDPNEPNFKIEKYTQDTLEDRSELFKKKLNIKYFIGAQFFFTNFAKKYSDHIHQSSNTPMTLKSKLIFLWKNRKIVKLLLSKRDSVGSLSSTELLAMTYQSTKKPIRSRWLKFLINLPTLFKKTEK